MSGSAPPPTFRSLRLRILVPIFAVSLIASLGVALGSYSLGHRRSLEEVASRYEGIRATLLQDSFPLTQPVVDLIARMTGTEIVTLDVNGDVANSSLDEAVYVPSFSLSEPEPKIVLSEESKTPFVCYAFHRESVPASQSVVVLFSENRIREARFRAAALPLVTGLSTVLLLTTVMLLLIGRLIDRLRRLQQDVDLIAEGDFETEIDPGPLDEIGLLARAVSKMKNQLGAIWDSLERQQGEKLLHQIAGGMAHQLRNSLTGARMALELHHRTCEDERGSLAMAMEQLEQTQQHVKRLVLVAAGRQERDQPAGVIESVEDALAAVQAACQHRGISLACSGDDSLRGALVSDGPSLSSAVSNLILNAMDESKEVVVNAVRVDSHSAAVEVRDRGHGPSPDVADDIFEPFVTSKAEGMGLGLPLVARSARHLGGTASWQRVDDQTCFRIEFQIRGAETE